MFISPCKLPYIAMHYEKLNWMNNIHIQNKFLHLQKIYSVLYSLLYAISYIFLYSVLYIPVYSIVCPVCSVYLVHYVRVLCTLYTLCCMTYSIDPMLCTHTLRTLSSVLYILCTLLPHFFDLLYCLHTRIWILDHLNQLYQSKRIPGSLCSCLYNYRLFTIFKLDHSQILKSYACYRFVYATLWSIHH